MKKKIAMPVYSNANDPWVIEHDGHYYYCWSGDAVHVREIENLSDIKNIDGIVVWEPKEGDYFSSEIWAPELHYLSGNWYIYVAVDNGKNENHRMLVLKGTSEDPTQPFELIGEIGTSDSHWAIDGTVLNYHDNLYFIWSGWEGRVDGQQNLYIAHMADPMTIDSERVLLSVPDQIWERNAMPINEGPVCLVDQNSVCLVYSASGSWTDDYCLGMLTLNNGDPMNPANWHKCDEPILTKSEGCYGPGHCSFVKDKDGTLMVVYHGNDLAGSGWSGRTCRLQPVQHHQGVSLQIGKALGTGETIEICE